jgi:two-component system response regulator FlrC
MYSSTATKRLLGIADSAWPESAPIEQLAMALGFEAVVSTQVEGLSRQKDLGVVVTKLQPGSSLQSMIESMRAFGEDVQFVIRADASDLQTVTTLARIPGVHVVGDSDFNESTWKPIFNAQLLANSVKDETSKVEPVAPQEQSLDYIFVDPKSQHLLALIERLAVTKAAVLLQGATGSGKEVLARTLHELSDRSNKPFIALNCAAMPEHLVEDMLFGHEKGAFTGATRELAGVFEQAQGGTVFLDEIGEMPIQLQAKLLRVLQEKEVVRLGGRDSIALDFRLVAATNKDLKAGIADKTFREDLYYRISAFKLQVPALAERRGDIVPLANSLATKHGCARVEFTEGALRQLYSYHWPGNVRELDNVIQRAVVFADYGRIDVEHIFFDEPIARADADLSQAMMTPSFEAPRMPVATPDVPMMARPRDLQSAVRASEYDVIMDAIRSTRTREEAAKKLGISPRTLRYKMARLRESSSGLSHCA